MVHRLWVGVATAALFTACSSNTGTGPGNNGTGGTGGTGGHTTGSFTAQVNGAAFNGNFYTTATLSGGILIVQGEAAASNTYKIITIAIANFTAPGTFSLAIGNANGANASWTDGATQWSTALTGGSGTVTVTAYDATHVAGTFSFTGVPVSGTNSVQVTNGNFDLKF